MDRAVEEKNSKTSTPFIFFTKLKERLEKVLVIVITINELTEQNTTGVLYSV